MSFRKKDIVAVSLHQPLLESRNCRSFCRGRGTSIKLFLHMLVLHINIDAGEIGCVLAREVSETEADKGIEGIRQLLCVGNTDHG